MYCPNCNTLNDDAARFCSKCGEYLEKQAPEGCPDCGAARKPEESFCSTCGHKFNGASTEPISSPPTVAPEQKAPGNHGQYGGGGHSPQYGSHGSTIYANEQVRFANFGERLVALIIDSIVLSIAGYILGAILMLSNGDLLKSFLSFIIGIGYKAGLEGSTKQATLGKMVMGIKVIGPDGGRISYGRAIGRYFANFLSVITLGIGYLMALFTREKRALHDYVAGTYVIRSK
ncbi:RDD family protein [Neobacillus notoginsengisoli]|uniref:RDD family protein n=1 Tax=Neobacillus notoginsengisoli TaxID=1578198 RepID=A0A417YXN0_9BACI|nr:RDD family protein [Neobacillus notoginsengisoli]RHW42155.1 RDD family protein [Neobacillus notoginsengisoli]